MKRLYTASLVLLALILVGLCSCGETSLRREMIGYWVGDSATLRAAALADRATAMADDGEAIFHANNLSIEDEQHLTLINDYTTSCIINGENTATRVAYYLVCTYKILGGALCVTAEVEKCRVELKSYTIEGVDYVEYLRQSLGAENEEEIQREAQETKERMERTMCEVFPEAYSDFKDRILATDLKVKDGVLTMQDDYLGRLCTYHRR